MTFSRAGSLCCLPLIFLLSCLSLQGADPKHAPIAFHDPLQDKNFFFLSAIQHTPEVRTLLQSNPALAQIAATKRTALIDSPRICAADVTCYARIARMSDDDVAQGRAAFTVLATAPEMTRFVDDVLRPSGMLQRYNSQPAAELLQKAWEDAARKMNRAIDIFALGQSPRFPGMPPGPPTTQPGPPPVTPAAGPPRIPGMEMTAYDVKTPAFARMVEIMAGVVGSDPKSLELFFEPSLRFSVELLRLHSRDEAGHFEPLESGENRAAFARIPTIDWNQFPYTVIVVLGNGPEREGIALAPVGRLRLSVAVRDYRAGKAPFILVSGGNVHPAFTPFNEALEMKKSLQQEFGIPENAIIVDPHARRTTTNLRNAVRLMYRYNIPFDRKGIILTDHLHSASVEAPAFMERCVRDFGYAPVRLGVRLSPFDLEFLPAIDCLHADASDLLDP